ncbi:MAG: type II toxin-antitoxin system RelE/ParE family toxin [Gammaproteobacteria bacterium]|nr:type II toxin-antitoxin system RelE/ParE family toxin [Gammaproteobacteria bacterium]
MVVRFSTAFKKQLRRLARKYRRIRADLGPLIAQLEADETPGEQVQGTGYTIYKVRVRNTDAQRGTSGGYRVIYYLATADDILLVAIYSKTEQDDIDNDTIVRVIRDDETP